ncbi:hypothetical protein AM500_13470 [Bacillus sp. FJAT-18017]|uniref:sensor histidine kinase n=1 Tax=Bacillus sp. FJAT-18017 TaxID=1705566 RepID=UPI0006AEC70B|nr:HAMP domain-containing sensor histidine kinase [Bacillus sp. FJAT-18017]ALC90680.1 hypothetical protein AM500_13470 [Bacillus sp. FJAT-18017]
MELVKDLFFNLTLVMLVIFMFNICSERFTTKSIKQTLGLLGLFISLLVCLAFGNPQGEFVIDLRQIPIIIAGFYYGYGLLFSVLSLVLRALFYGVDLGLLTVLPLYLIAGIFLHYAYPWFQKLAYKKRMMAILLTSLAMNLFFFFGLIVISSTYSGMKILIEMSITQLFGVGILAFFIEELRRNDFYREQMVKAQKIELASHMSAAISHEVRNPLTAVQGFLQLAAEDKEMKETTRGYIKIALTELEIAEKVIKDYLTFAQPSLERNEQFEVGNELNQILQSLQPLANMNSVEVKTVYGDGLVVFGDKSKFRQCFLNIMKNCIEAMPIGGNLTIHTERTIGEVFIRISDTGIGMSEEQINRLGEPYYSTKGKKGTGLGLMVSFSILREMKGTINIRSKLGKGTEFLVSFPSAK